MRITSTFESLTAEGKEKTETPEYELGNRTMTWISTFTK